MSNLKEVKPTVFFGVPRIFERFQAGVAATAFPSQLVCELKLQQWARSVGTQVTTLYAIKGQEPGGLLAIAAQNSWQASWFFPKSKIGLGLEEARVLIVSAAPISPDILHFFASLDMPILELYGQSEDCGPSTTNRLGAIKIGTVGQAWPGSEVKAGPRWRNFGKRAQCVLRDTLRMKQRQQSDLVDGWLHSGDLGPI